MRHILVFFASAVRVALVQSAEYGAFPAAKKADYLWSQITSDEAGGAFMNPLETAIRASSAPYLREMASVESDWREPSHKKITHGIGGHARAHIEWLPNPYSGMFQ